MCGIIGYVGNRKVIPILMKGLKKLEYRGYDSAGVAIINKDNKIEINKCKGKINYLEKMISKKNLNSSIGLGHTRWATHGKPDNINAHPHFSEDCQVVVVHNGIIENYLQIKSKLISEGYRFFTETDTEVLPNLIQKNYRGNLTEAVRKSLKHVNGSYAIGVISTKEPDKIVVSRKGSPLIIGIGEQEMFIASDIPALLDYTRKVIFLDEEEVATIEKNKIFITDSEGEEIEKEPVYIDWSAEMAEKKGYKHFMLKEIYQQPLVVRENLRKNIINEEIIISNIDQLSLNINQIEKIYITACGTAYYAAMVGKYVIEKLTNVPVEIDYASEFRYRTKILNKKTLGIVISQSGETADTIAAMRSCQKEINSILAIVNVRGSTISREADHTMYINAGPEIGVASTKAFIGQIISLYLFALSLGKQMKTITKDDERKYIQEMMTLPHKIENILNQGDNIREIAKRYCHYKHFLYLGRNIHFPIALEGALKLKEISYIHAEAYPAGEMKHGPIALLDNDFPVVATVLHDGLYLKMISNIKEVTARNAKVIAVASYGDEQIRNIVEEVIYIPNIEPILYPILSVIPLQLFAYHMADLLGKDVDKPRNLAKSVTVE